MSYFFHRPFHILAIMSNYSLLEKSLIFVIYYFDACYRFWHATIAFIVAANA